MKKAAATVSAQTETFTPAHDFAGYPFGRKVDFRAGMESIPVPPEFAKLCREKGHVAQTNSAPDAE
jgi:hypothetical protein